MTEINQKILKEYLHYSPETGVFTWIKTSGPQAIIGSAAGTNLNGYIKIRLLRKPFSAHRLAWLYMTGQWPNDFIDHINGDPSDNRFYNLREASNSENQRNRTKAKHNKSGYKRVWLHSDMKKWAAKCTVNGKRHHLGVFKTAEEASIAYQEFAKRHHGEFYREAQDYVA
jgi:HNH endonuclease